MTNIGSKFKGFNTDTKKFIVDLTQNNNKLWFEENRKRYQTFLYEPFQSLVMSLGDTIQKIDPLLDITPKTDHTISRIYRDTRFSEDKSPFKTCYWLTFKRPGKNWRDEPAFFFEMSLEGYRYGMGFFMASNETMDNLRDLIRYDADCFRGAIQSFYHQHTFTISGERYKKRRFNDLDEDLSDWYERKNLYFVCEKNSEPALYSAKLADELIIDFLLLEPLYKLLWEAKLFNA
jgi:uncharacterized protein (TIGR02453 family)